MKFIRSNYWKTWSRVLWEPTDRLPYYVEVNLTPIPGSNQDGWEKVVSTWVRRHCTRRSDKDLMVETLPPEVVLEIKQGIGETVLGRCYPFEIYEHLTYVDFLGQIDWEKYNRVNNGGAPLKAILK